MNQFSDDLRLLTEEEMLSINGGESLWYWIAYGIGATGRFFYELWKFCEEHPFEVFNA